MFLLNVSYIKAPSQVEPHIKAHGEWVAKYLAEGLFLFAGPKKSGFRRCHWSCQHRKRKPNESARRGLIRPGRCSRVSDSRFRLQSLPGLIVVCDSCITVAFKTVFYVFTGIGPDNSLERFTERSVGLVTDQPRHIYELFVALFE
jgi:hypothetical protein